MRIADKVAFLNKAASFLRPTRQVSVRETHTAFVFLTDDRAYKLKKPVRLAYLDFTTLKAREHFCREELRLNRELAGDIYIAVRALCKDRDGTLNLAERGEAVDWLVEMVRLPDGEMLDNRLLHRQVERAEILALANRLSDFYEQQRERAGSGQPYVRHLLREASINREHLHAMRCHLPSGAGSDELARACEARLREHLPEIKTRIEAGLIVEGHGDLRPEHICLLTPPVIFDRLEFDPGLRLIDVYDEVIYLGLECRHMGCGWIGPLLLDHLTQDIGSPPSDGLLGTYSLFRHLLRARLAIDHLHDPRPRTPEKWPAQAQSYLDAARCLTRAP